MALHNIRQPNDPASAPTQIGQHFTNTVSKEQWFSIDIASVADWIKNNDASALDHNAMSNLPVGDVHLQYYNLNGVRALTGNMDAGNFDITNIKDLIVNGDFTVNGTTTFINTVNTVIKDANIILNKGGTQATADAQDSGFTVEMSDAIDAIIGYDSTLVTKFKIGEVGSEVEIADISSSQTFLNKTINADNNTISELELDNLKAGVLDTDLSSVSALDDTVASAKAIRAFMDANLVKESFSGIASAAQVAIGATPVDIIFDTVCKNTNGSVFSLNIVTGELTISKTGVFMITYLITADTDDNARRESRSRILRDTGSGYVLIPNSEGMTQAFAYHRQSNAGKSTYPISVILDVTSGDKFKIQINQNNGTGTIKTVGDASTVIVEEK